MEDIPNKVRDMLGIIVDSPEPEFKTIGGEMWTVFEFKQSAQQDNEPKDEPKKLSDRQMLILELVQENPSMAQQEMSHRIGVSFATLKRELSFLRQEGYITREGGKTYGHWVINNPTN